MGVQLCTSGEAVNLSPSLGRTDCAAAEAAEDFFEFSKQVKIHPWLSEVPWAATPCSLQLEQDRSGLGTTHASRSTGDSGGSWQSPIPALSGLISRVCWYISIVLLLIYHLHTITMVSEHPQSVNRYSQCKLALISNQTSK